METIFVVGVDTVVGGNLAARLAETHRVIGLPFREPVAIAGCTIAGRDPVADARWLRELDPAWIVHCGGDAAPAATRLRGDTGHLAGAPEWSRLAGELGGDFTFVSSDAVFRGPRLFHDEGSDGFEDSDWAVALRSAESACLDANPAALVVRTNAFGWSPTGCGWLESLRDAPASFDAARLDHRRHSTPLPARHLVSILCAARDAKLTGVRHAGGAERVGHFELVVRLARALDVVLPPAARPSGDARAEPVETSLRSSTISAELQLSLPMIDEGIQAVVDELEEGIVERLTGAVPVPRELVA